MRDFGLIGRNISYSFSKEFFKHKFESQGITGATYSVFDIDNLREIHQILQNKNLKGFNVTIPYKQEIISFLDELNPEAEKIGAVNCVKISNKKLIGYNTDAFGFRKSLQPLLKEDSIKALILGDGGAAKAVKYILEELNISYKTVRRNKGFTYSQLTEKDIQDHSLIINCTPLGTFPEVEEMPLIPYEFLTKNHVLFDLIYNPSKTRFLEMGELKGATIKNGNEMLVFQAEKSWEIWNLPL